MFGSRKACLVALVLSCAGAEESCSPDAEAVLPREGRQLLQASIKPALREAAAEVSDSASAAAGVARELELVTKKAQDLSGAGRPPSDEEMTVFKAMKKTLAESTLPGITASHKADQALLDNAATAFSQCDAMLANDHDAQLQGDREALVAAIKEYTDVSLAKATLMTGQNSKNAEVQAFLHNNARPACGADAAEPSEALYQEVVKMKTFADGYAERWLSKVAADKAVAGNEGTLALAKQSVEIRHCGYQSLFRTASFDYDSCWASAEADFKTTTDTVTAHNPILKAHLRSASMIQCLLKVLMAAGSTDTALATGAVQDCSQVQVDTSALELAVPKMGEKRSLSGYDVPESPVDVPCEGGGDATDTRNSGSWTWTALFDNVGEAEFNRIFREAGTGIVRRECPDCASTHKEIYLEVSRPESWNAYQELLITWTADGFESTFNLYSSLADLQAGKNPWTACNGKDANVGFPRDCGPTRLVGGQWYGLNRGGRHVKFSVLTRAN